MPFTKEKTEEILKELKDTFIGLHSGEPNEVNEVSKQGYSRKKGNLENVVYNQLMNTTDIIFDVAQFDYGVITHIGIYDTAIGGKLLYWVKANNSREVRVSEDYRISKDNLLIEIVV